MSTDRRGALIAFCFIAGLAAPTLGWGLALMGFTRADFPIDYAAVVMVCLCIYAPVLVFLNNPGERRSRFEQLTHFAWLWFFANAGFQLAWELPWFLLKETLMYGNITEADTWFWPWWAYGVADTRYLSHHDLTLGISAMDGSVALLEAFAVYLFFRGYRVKAAWLGLIFGACMSWGQFFFYIGEIYNGFAHIEDGWFGFWMKYGVMNLPWCVFPFAATVGFMWFLAVTYKKRGVEEYLAGRQIGLDTPFVAQSELYLTVGPEGDPIAPPANDRQLRRLSALMFASPFVVLGVDALLWMQRF